MQVNYSKVAERFGDQFRANESLARYTVARLGGTADAVVRVKNIEDLIWVTGWAHQKEVRWLLIGGGANVLFADQGFKGLVIINDASAVKIDESTGLVEAESGANLTTLARHCMSKGLKGLEWGVSVPGTVGGAVVNNAGAHGGDTAHCLTTAEILDLEEAFPFLGNDVVVGLVEKWSVWELDYQYRYSRLKGQHGRYVVLRAWMQLEPGHNSAELNAAADEFINYRKSTQPPGASLGSMFKNPPGDYAGRLIEAAGLKGTKIGGVQISPVHANFFVNTGNGTAADYQALIDLAQKQVKEQFGVDLELEIEMLGDWAR